MNSTDFFVEKINHLSQMLKITRTALRDITEKFEQSEADGTFGKYPCMVWEGDDYLIDAALSVLDLVDDEFTDDEWQPSECGVDDKQEAK